MVPPARTVDAMASTASAMPASAPRSDSSVTDGRRKRARGRFGVLTALHQQGGERGRETELTRRDGRRRPGRAAGRPTQRSTGAGKTLTTAGYAGGAGHHADPAPSAGYRIAPQPSQPSRMAPLRIWLRRLSGTEV